MSVANDAFWFSISGFFGAAATDKAEGVSHKSQEISISKFAVNPFCGHLPSLNQLSSQFQIISEQLITFFEGYERQYCELSANLSRKCNSTSLLPDGVEKNAKVNEVKSGLDDCDVLIRKMDLEARSLQPSVKAMFLAKLREYKSDLNKLKREFKRITSGDVSHASREELLEAGMADAHSVCISSFDYNNETPPFLFSRTCL
ncbi:vesicle transport v-SNARE 12-like isoform X1 [Populus alba x Populus x berolinensis]|nr:vesicle transport v-SNARE 12-like isoform X1 [Populus alba x Populus x berolinensis]